MAISLYVPSGKRNISSFIMNELHTAKNIKDKRNKDSITSGLKKFAHYI